MLFVGYLSDLSLMVPHENSPIENMAHAMINALIGQ